MSNDTDVKDCRDLCKIWVGNHWWCDQVLADLFRFKFRY